MLPALVLSDLPSHCTNPSQSSLYLSHLQTQGAEDYQGTEQAAQGWVSSYSLSRCLYPQSGTRLGSQSSSS